jgi:hypothetical protein
MNAKEVYLVAKTVIMIIGIAAILAATIYNAVTYGFFR